jgi:hypothetical protein
MMRLREPTGKTRHRFLEATIWSQGLAGDTYATWPGRFMRAGGHDYKPLI